MTTRAFAEFARGGEPMCVPAVRGGGVVWGGEWSGVVKGQLSDDSMCGG